MVDLQQSLQHLQTFTIVGLEELKLDKTTISGLLLPSQEESNFKELYVQNLVQLFFTVTCCRT